jgi:ceramide glucosyltransferase
MRQQGRPMLLGAAGPTMGADQEMLNLAYWVLLTACIAISIGALAYVLLAIWCVWRLPRTAHADVERLPAITVLKPLCGDEPRLREALLSFCRQDFPAPLQIIFGVRSPSDAALPVAQELKAQHPHLDIEIVVDPRVYGPNFKASNVINMMRVAKHNMIIVSDSDIVVGPDSLRQIGTRFAVSDASVVSCLYRGAPVDPDSRIGQLGSLYIDGYYLPAAAVDASISGVSNCYSPLLALRREFIEGDLDNFHVLTNAIGDDAHIGRVAVQRGRKIEIAPFLVLTTVPETRFSELLMHELRWARTMRALRPIGSVAAVFIHALPIALLMVLLNPGPPTALLFGLIAASRALLLAAVEVRLGRAPTAKAPPPWSLIFREFLCFGVWSWSFASRKIVYRGRKLRIQPGARILAGDFIAAGLPPGEQGPAR